MEGAARSKTIQGPGCVGMSAPRGPKHAIGENGKFSFSLDRGLPINRDPRVTAHATVAVEANDQRRICAGARQHALKEQAALKTVAIRQARQLTQSQCMRGQPRLRVAIARSSGSTPGPPREPFQGHDVL